MSSAQNTVLNPNQNCATISISLHDLAELLHRIEKLEQHIIVDRREVLRKELATLEDGFQLTRTYEKRIR